MNNFVVGSVLLSVMLLSDCGVGSSNSYSNSNDNNNRYSPAIVLDGQLYQNDEFTGRYGLCDLLSSRAETGQQRKIEW